MNIECEKHGIQSIKNINDRCPMCEKVFMNPITDPYGKIKLDFRYAYRNHVLDSVPVLESETIDRMCEWWIDKMRASGHTVYHHLRSKVVVLQGELPVVHAEYLEDIKKIYGK